jgi:hypothetical protein
VQATAVITHGAIIAAAPDKRYVVADGVVDDVSHPYWKPVHPGVQLGLCHDAGEDDRVHPHELAGVVLGDKFGLASRPVESVSRVIFERIAILTGKYPG